MKLQHLHSIVRLLGLTFPFSSYITISATSATSSPIVEWMTSSTNIVEGWHGSKGLCSSENALGGDDNAFDINSSIRPSIGWELDVTFHHAHTTACDTSRHGSEDVDAMARVVSSLLINDNSGNNKRREIYDVETCKSRNESSKGGPDDVSGSGGSSTRTITNDIVHLYDEEGVIISSWRKGGKQLVPSVTSMLWHYSGKALTPKGSGRYDTHHTSSSPPLLPPPAIDVDVDDDATSVPRNSGNRKRSATTGNTGGATPLSSSAKCGCPTVGGWAEAELEAYSKRLATDAKRVGKRKRGGPGGRGAVVALNESGRGKRDDADSIDKSQNDRHWPKNVHSAPSSRKAHLICEESKRDAGTLHPCNFNPVSDGNETCWRMIRLTHTHPPNHPSTA
jgi:hypothetical protein